MSPYPYPDTATYREYRRRYMAKYLRKLGIIKTPYNPQPADLKRRKDKKEVPPEKRWKTSIDSRPIMRRKSRKKGGG